MVRRYLFIACLLSCVCVCVWVCVCVCVCSFPFTVKDSPN